MKRSPLLEWRESIHKNRSVYRWGGAWVHAMIIAAPWLNVIILVGTLFAVHNRIAITPGVIFDLPQAPFSEGAAGGLTVLMFSVSRETQLGEETQVFFDDERYRIQNEEEATRLANRLGESIGTGRRQDILLLADKRVPHGDVMRFVYMARQAGARQINVAEKPE